METKIPSFKKHPVVLKALQRHAKVDSGYDDLTKSASFDTRSVCQVGSTNYLI